LRGAENSGKEIRNKLADHHIGVGHRQRAAAAIAFWAGIGAGRIRADAKPRAVEMQYRAATGCHGVNEHHRRPHCARGDLGFECALVLAGKCDTSVEVPPMSKPISRENPAARPVSAMPTTPAAGPDRIASLPRIIRPRETA